MPTILVTGGTGMIGRVLVKALLDKGYDVIVLTRKMKLAGHHNPQLRYAQWDPEKQFIDENAVSSADHIIHLAGEGIADRRWTKKRKKAIIESRVKGGQLLVKAIREYPNHIRSVISAAAIGWYGPDRKGLSMFVETDPPYNDFAATVCKEWEKSLLPLEEMGKRLVFLRAGVVLSPEGGALKRFLATTRWGIAPILGNGKQMISWIHIEDLARMYITAIEQENLKGVFNAVTPHPVTNRNFIIQLAKTEKGRFFIPVYVPVFVLQIVFGELSTEVLKSETISCEKIKKEAGFIFRFPIIKSALEDLLK